VLTASNITAINKTHAKNEVAHDLFIAVMMEAVRISETFVYFNNITLRYIPEGCHLHTLGFQNLKSHETFSVGIVYVRSEGCLFKKIPCHSSLWALTRVTSKSFLRGR
jgi:hypothetical protein